MLGYATDTVRGTALAPVQARRRISGITAVLGLLVVGLAVVAWDIWATVQAPGEGLDYLQLASGLLIVAFPVSMLVRGPARMTVLIAIGGILTEVAVSLWNAAQAPADWVNYFVAAWLAFLLLLWWSAGRWAHTRRA